MKRKILILPLLVFGLSFLFSISCNKKDCSTPSYTIGQSFGGGKIFYIDKSGLHGLIASISDQSTAATYYNGSYITTNAISTTDGSANTTLIISVQGNIVIYAAKLCRDFSGGGFNDWFLPSKDQLNTLYSQKAIVGGFANEYYWSSTEFNNELAWSQVFGGVIDGNQYNFSKGLIGRVRAIRAF